MTSLLCLGSKEVVAKGADKGVSLSIFTGISTYETAFYYFFYSAISNEFVCNCRLQ
jgi:hypothetical protein